MEDQPAHEPQPDSGGNTPPPTTITVIEPGPSPDEQPSNSDNAQEPQTIEREATPIIIQEDNRSDTVAKVANFISAGALIIAAITFIYTYLLFVETQKANEATQDALNHQIGKEAVDEFIEYKKAENQKVINAENKKIHDSDIKRQGELIELQKASTQAQIDAFKEQGRRFEIENRATLDLKSFLLKSIPNSDSLAIVYDLKNISNVTVRIVKESVIIAPSFKPIFSKKEIENAFLKTDFHNSSEYIGSQEKLTINFPAETEKNNLNRIKGDKPLLHAFITVKYIDPLKGTQKTLKVYVISYSIDVVRYSIGFISNY